MGCAMRFKRILLVQAKYDSVFSNVLPAGIGYLSAFLASQGIEHDVFDLNVERHTTEQLFRKAASFGPDLIGFSMMSLNYRYNYDVMRRLKAAFPGVRIAVGGAHLSTMRADVLGECEAIDYGVVLEGEHTLTELAVGTPLAEIGGLLYRDGGKVVYTGDRPFIQDLDRLPFPRYDKFCREEYSPLMSLFSSRGCPYECTYCPVQLAIGRRFVARSPASVVDELEYHYRRGSRQFSFRDDNFTLDQARVYAVCDEIERRGLRGLYLMCDNGVRADRIDRPLLARMKEVGFRMIGLGVESGDDRVLKRLKKSATVKVMEEAIRTACELGYIVELYLLIGAPGETWQDFEKTVALARKYPVLIASFYHLLPYPNTELYAEAKESGYLLRAPDEYLNDGSQRRNTPFLATPEFPADLRRKAFEYAYRSTAPHVRRARRLYARGNARSFFVERGVPGPLASLCAGLYAAPVVYDVLFGSPYLMSLRKRLKNRSRVAAPEAG